MVAGLLLSLYGDFKQPLFYICYRNNNLNFAYVICSFKTKNQSATLNPIFYTKTTHEDEQTSSINSLSLKNIDFIFHTQRNNSKET